MLPPLFLMVCSISALDFLVGETISLNTLKFKPPKTAVCGPAYGVRILLSWPAIAVSFFSRLVILFLLPSTVMVLSLASASASAFNFMKSRAERAVVQSLSVLNLRNRGNRKLYLVWKLIDSTIDAAFTSMTRESSGLIQTSGMSPFPTSMYSVGGCLRSQSFHFPLVFSLMFW